MPRPAPRVGDAPGITCYELPLAVQDRSFWDDGSLFCPDTREYFDGMMEPDRPSPIWNPEFFGDTMVVNGRRWPYLEVEARRYRFRVLNGCNSQFPILALDRALPFTVIGGEQGFLPNAPASAERLPLGPAPPHRTGRRGGRSAVAFGAGRLYRTRS